MNILGLMSGSSLDGLDMALCNFVRDLDGDKIQHSILKVKSVELPEDLIAQLKASTLMNARDLLALSATFGAFLGNSAKQFIAESDFSVDLIASHGHTIFHHPENNFTLQIGDGAIIAQVAQKDTICDFRSSDIACGGNGAPFAPIADAMLFPETDICLNLGGISNITFKQNGSVMAFDISPCNQLLNFLAQKMGESFDRDGEIAAVGKVNHDLLQRLIASNSFNQMEPRAIDNSWVSETFFPLLADDSIPDDLATSVEFINLEIVKACQFQNYNESKQILVTGGGAFNKFLINDLSDKLRANRINIVNVSDEVIEFKEALLVSLLGYLRINKLPNALGSVTGASRDSIGGCIYTYS